MKKMSILAGLALCVTIGGRICFVGVCGRVRQFS